MSVLVSASEASSCCTRRPLDPGRSQSSWRGLLQVMKVAPGRPRRGGSGRRATHRHKKPVEQEPHNVGLAQPVSRFAPPEAWATVHAKLRMRLGNHSI